MAMRTHEWHSFTIIKFTVLLLIFWMTVIRYSEARPQWTLPAPVFMKHFESHTQCDNDNDLLELCQRCAKATKSNVAYPMCCTDSEHAVRWCKDYLYYGLS